MAARIPTGVLKLIEQWNEQRNYGDINLHFYDGKIVQASVRQTLKVEKQGQVQHVEAAVVQEMKI